ncbi:MAG: prepilin-type N-terminal cleavage/methylation domain-containing protein [Deltaproteobacteria bacterium]|nr:prepilin-type N-terminal cleavage/methylation domain-containing protein [Deltaproteobacteria bacterium]
MADDPDIPFQKNPETLFPEVIEKLHKMNHRKKAKIISMRHGYHPNSDAGFTLLEVMISVSIIAIVLVSVYKMQAQTISMNYMSEYQTTASLLAQQKIAELETASPDSVTSDSGGFGDDFPGYRWHVTIDEIDSEFLGEVSDDIKKMDVTISLNQDENVFSVSLYRFLRD